MQKRNNFLKFILCLLVVALVVADVPSGALVAKADPLGEQADETGLSGEFESYDLEEFDDWDEDEFYLEYAQWVEEAAATLREIAAEREIMALVYLEDTYPVRAEASYDGETIVTVYSGQQVDILDTCIDREFEIWDKVSLEINGQEVTGFVPRRYLAVSDSRFLEWEMEYGVVPFTATTFALEEEPSYPDIATFPESYQPALKALKEQHPQWTFVKMNTNLDWSYVIQQELLNGRSLVHKSLPDWTKNGLYDTGSWYYATPEALMLYMDPRNGLTEDRIFQFEQLTYNEEYHTLEAVNRFLSNTFMNSNNPAPGVSLTFAELFYYLGKEDGRKVSPFHLAARVLQEQGQGTSPMISGSYPGYEGYYNYFNIGATGRTNTEVIVSGLTYAKNHDWSNAYFAIQGGADFISANYIRKGQDTLYLQKFNVNPNGTYKPFSHQYMQNITAPTTEAGSIKKLYASTGSLDNTFVFKIPVYLNMPAEACKDPTQITESLDITVELPEGYTSDKLWLDGVEYTGILQEKNLKVMASDKNAVTAVAYKYDESNVPVGMYVWSLEYKNGAYVVTPEPTLEDLLSYHGFSIRITGNNGIRFKTGISKELRAKLIANGDEATQNSSENGNTESANGYKLKEYGTLVMSASNLGTYSMIKDGQKVKSGMAYGYDAQGSYMDYVLEDVDGRYRFASVLVGLPTTQYKNEFAFRGYIILEKNGKSYTLYGPVVARSIYTLAQRLLEKGTYAPETSTYNYLKQLVTDADALEQ